ncbi:MAG: KpsF/GutQ family sugar-phosphate isomerase [Chitinophagia bacterium]|jgi:arabinose-5-phosphate isomerase
MDQRIISIANRTLEIEAAAINELHAHIDAAFVEVVKAVYATKGRLVISGIGKSAIIAQKIVATLNSTGTAALYLHAADAIHGDSGMIHPADIVLIISKSGESPEIKNLVQLIQQFGNTLVAMVGNKESYLAKQANWVLDTTVAKEACVHNLAPTASTTAQMVMGDLLAMCLMEIKEFKATDFAKFHPGGNLGKRLTLTAGQMAQVNPKPWVVNTTPLKEVIVTISKNRLGAAVLVDDKENVLGIITDGDIRRMLEQHASIQDLTAAQIAHSSPITIGPNALAVAALALMEKNDISQLVVAVDKKYMGMIHIHDLMKEGIL